MIRAKTPRRLSMHSFSTRAWNKPRRISPSVPFALSAASRFKKGVSFSRRSVGVDQRIQEARPFRDVGASAGTPFRMGLEGNVFSIVSGCDHPSGRGQLQLYRRSGTLVAAESTAGVSRAGLCDSKLPDSNRRCKTGRIKLATSLHPSGV
jgi:hypothetical protein